MPEHEPSDPEFWLQVIRIIQVTLDVIGRVKELWVRRRR